MGNVLLSLMALGDIAILQALPSYETFQCLTGKIDNNNNNF